MNSRNPRLNRLSRLSTVTWPVERWPSKLSTAEKIRILCLFIRMRYPIFLLRFLFLSTSSDMSADIISPFFGRYILHPPRFYRRPIRLTPYGVWSPSFQATTATNALSVDVFGIDWTQQAKPDRLLDWTIVPDLLIYFLGGMVRG